MLGRLGRLRIRAVWQGFLSGWIERQRETECRERIQLEATIDEIAYCAAARRRRSTKRRLQSGHRHAVQMERLESRRLLAGEPLMITEFMASNGATLQDRFREYSDWVEIYNPTDQAVELGGWRLTDDAADLSKWQFPAASVAARGYLVVFASGRNQVEVGKELHTNFQLASDGDYLALVRADGTVAHAYAPQYPQQYADVAYGLAFDDMGPRIGQLSYFATRDSRPAQWSVRGLEPIDRRRGQCGARFFRRVRLAWR